MSLPVAEMGNRSGETEEPRCGKCGYPTLLINGHLGCARCDKPEKNSAKTFIVKDKNGNIQRFNSEEEMNKTLGVNKVTNLKPRRLTQKEIEELGPEEEVTQRQAVIGVKGTGGDAKQAIPSTVANYKIAFELIDRELKNVTFESMAEAKKILSVRKKLNTLRFDVDNLIGG